MDVDPCLFERLEHEIALDAIANLACGHEIVGIVILSVRERHEVVPIHLEEKQSVPPLHRSPKQQLAVQTTVSLKFKNNPALLSIRTLASILRLRDAFGSIRIKLGRSSTASKLTVEDEGLLSAVDAVFAFHRHVSIQCEMLASPHLTLQMHGV